MRLSSLVSRTKKFFSKKRVGYKKELGDIFADGLSRRKVEVEAREFQAKAIRREANAASHNYREKKLKLFLHNSRVGRSDSEVKVSPSFDTTIDMGEKALIEKDNAFIFSEKARVARRKAVARRLYSQRELKKTSRKK
ncbi:MAG: hypothetical protein PHO61_02110 [Candidatus ainarchaeum sp.]|nr:hypothetical protein [Candidatus ainarchaeum sp.]MDD4467943.1 hypothetical protein [Candidatus ainarchaeum sp.]